MVLGGWAFDRWAELTQSSLYVHIRTSFNFSIFSPFYYAIPHPLPSWVLSITSFLGQSTSSIHTIPLSSPKSTCVEGFHFRKRTQQQDRPVYTFPLDTSSQGSVFFCICFEHRVFALSSFLSAARTGYSSHDACHIRQILRSSLTQRLFFHHTWPISRGHNRSRDFVVRLLQTSTSTKDHCECPCEPFSNDGFNRICSRRTKCG